MATKQGWWQRLLAAVSRVYERRIRAASLVGEYGAPHAAQEDDAADAEILNLPPGSQIGSRRGQSRLLPPPTD